jgi:hypothetical protein
MLTALRAQRIVALVLLLLAPGVSGSAIQWLHSCPAESDAAEHQHHEGSTSHSGEAPCDCIGSCTPAGLVAVPLAGGVRVGFDRTEVQLSRPPAASFTPSSTRSHLLPPATAPPLV